MASITESNLQGESGDPPLIRPPQGSGRLPFLRNREDHGQSPRTCHLLPQEWQDSRQPV